MTNSALMALMTARIMTPHIGEDGKPHVGYAQGSQEQAYELDADGEYDVLIYYAQTFAGYFYGL